MNQDKHYFQKAVTPSITIRVKNGFSYINQEDIVFCHKDNQDAIIHLRNGATLGIDCMIDDLEACLPALHFYRVHPAYIINIGHVQDWMQLEEEENYFFMKDGKVIPVSYPFPSDLKVRVLDKLMVNLGF